MCIYVEMDAYLAQWFINDHGGSEPVTLRKGSVEAKVLEMFLTRRPADVAPDVASPGLVAVEIPEFRVKPAAYYNHLPRRARQLLLETIRGRFDVDLWRTLSEAVRAGLRLDDTAWAWMEGRGIETTETNYNAVIQRYQRQRRIYSAGLRQKKHYLRKKSL